MRDWRSALQSGTMRNVVASMLLLDAAGLYLAYRETGRAVGDGSLLDDVAATVTVRADSDFLPAPLPRPQAVVRVEFSDIPAAAPFAGALDPLARIPALPSEEFRPEPLAEPPGFASDQAVQPASRESPRRAVRMAVSLPAPEEHRPTMAFATAFPAADGQGADGQGADGQGPGAPSIAVDQTVYWGASPATVSGHPVTAGGLDEQAPAVVDGPADLYARAGEIAAGTGSSDGASQDTANDPQPAAELLVWARAGARAAGIP